MDEIVVLLRRLADRDPLKFKELSVKIIAMNRSVEKNSTKTD